MNYVICMMRLNGDTTYLDASRPYLGFGNLSIDCYNGHSRIISTNGGPLYFLPEDIKEQTSTTAFVFNKEKGKLAGSISIAYGVFGSEKLRKEIMSVGQTKYFENIKTECAGEPTFVQTAVDSLHKPEFPATVHVDFEMPFTGDILYFNPVIHTEYSKNPFNSDQRKYPVVLPYPIDELYTLNMEIPEGYAVDELPKSTKVSFNGNDGSFEYLIQADQNSIQFRTHIRLSEVNFPAEDYGSLRDFFAFILKKYGEQIVLKRKQP